MRLRIIAEIAILMIFLTVALVAILGRNVATSADMEDSVSAEEYAQRGDRIYASGRSRFNEASIQYWEAVKRNPDMPDVYLKLAAIYYEYDWNYQTLHELSEVERIDPNYPGLALLLGKVHDKMADADKAFEAFQRAVTLEPGNAEAHFYLGAIYQQRAVEEEATRMEKEAISEYEKAVESGPGSAAALKAHLQLGRIYRNKNPEKAEKEFREALGLDPASAEAISELRNLYRHEAEDYENRDEYDKAAEKYEEIVKIDPNSPRNVEIYMKLGNIYRSNELYDRAVAVYEAATKLDPLNFDAFSALKELEMLRETDSRKKQNGN